MVTLARALGVIALSPRFLAVDADEGPVVTAEELIDAPIDEVYRRAGGQDHAGRQAPGRRGLLANRARQVSAGRMTTSWFDWALLVRPSPGIRGGNPPRARDPRGHSLSLQFVRGVWFFSGLLAGPSVAKVS